MNWARRSSREIWRMTSGLRYCSTAVMLLYSTRTTAGEACRRGHSEAVSKRPLGAWGKAKRDPAIALWGFPSVQPQAPHLLLLVLKQLLSTLARVRTSTASCGMDMARFRRA